MQNKVKIFNGNKACHKKSVPIYARILDAQSELGEMAKEYLENSKYGTEDFVLTEDFKMEYGDVLYCLLSLANEIDVNADECLDMAIQKYQKRINEKQTMSSENKLSNCKNKS